MIDRATGADQHRNRWPIEMLLVLALSLGASAVYALINLTATLTQSNLRSAQTNMNQSVTPRPWLDLTYQITGLVLDLAPVALALYFLWQTNPKVLSHIGLDNRRLWFDLRWGVVLASVIGIPGIGLYLLGRYVGLTVRIVPDSFADYWWTVPVLLAAALKNALLEEVIAVAFLTDRLERMRWGVVAIIIASAGLRGTYHLYQGFGPFLGNVAMGVIFALFFIRTRRVMPLVIAHYILDAVAFSGYDLIAPYLPSWA